MPAGRKRKPALEALRIPVWTKIDLPMKARADRLAKTRELSLSRILRKALSEYLDREAA